MRDDYTEFKYKAEGIECKLKDQFYTGVFERPKTDRPLEITVETAMSVLQLAAPSWRRAFSSFNDPPSFHTADSLLTPTEPKKLPAPPDKPKTPEPSWLNDMSPDWYSTRITEIASRIEALQAEIHTKYKSDIELTNTLKDAYSIGESRAIETVAMLAVTRNPLPEQLCLDVHTDYDSEARVLLATIEVPDFKRLTIFKKRYERKEVSATEKKKLSEYILYSLCIRTAYLIADNDSKCMFDTVAVNASQKWNDLATGTPCEGIIASFQACKSELVALQIENVDPKACFRHFSGIATPSIERVAPIRPIFVMDKNDSRHIENRDIDEFLEADTNLASMPWDDFEHLVRQLFEWEFGQNGIEVKVTCASRDRGVDAIMYDPDPLRGGKYVLQAKRYTRTVDVASVRELYGTVVNEGVNRLAKLTHHRRPKLTHPSECF